MQQNGVKISKRFAFLLNKMAEEWVNNNKPITAIKQITSTKWSLINKMAVNLQPKNKQKTTISFLFLFFISTIIKLSEFLIF